MEKVRGSIALKTTEGGHNLFCAKELQALAGPGGPWRRAAAKTGFQPGLVRAPWRHAGSAVMLRMSRTALA